MTDYYVPRFPVPKKKCVYHAVCLRYPRCPEDRGDESENYDCLRQKGCSV